MESTPDKNNAYYETVENAMRKLSEASSVLNDISLKITRFKEQSGHGNGQEKKEE